jgi:hypothetical protein
LFDSLSCAVVELLLVGKGKRRGKREEKKREKKEGKKGLSSQVSMNSFRGVTLRCANVGSIHLGE